MAPRKAPAKPAPKAATKPTAPKGIPEGVYFNLSFDEYHADPAIGSGDLRRLLRSAPDYWYASILNPQRVRETTTPGRTRGKAMHTMVLEGTQAFASQFTCEPTGDGVLYTVADLTAWLKDHGVMWPKGTKTELAHRVKQVAKKLRIKPPVMADEFRAAAVAAGLTVLPFDDFARIQITSAMITKNPELADAFKGGVSEVSVFWRRTPGGPMLKCRFDYLKVRGIGDLKAITNTMGVDFSDACVTNFVRYRYDVQAFHYLEGRAMLPLMVRAGKVFGKHDKKWLAEVAASHEYAFVFVFFQAEGAPITDSFKITPANLRDFPDHILAEAAADVDTALARYDRAMQTFGPHEMWIRITPTRELHREDLRFQIRRNTSGD